MFRYILAVFLGGCSYGTLAIFVKTIYKYGYSTADVICGQYLFGLLILWASVILSRRFLFNKRSAFHLLLCGIPMAATTLFYYVALKTLSASLAVICMFQFVWMGTLMDMVVNHRKPGIRKCFAILLLLIGSVLGSGFLSEAGSFHFTSGLLWALLSAFTYALFILVSGTVARETPPVEKSAIMATGAAILIYIFYPPDFISHPETLLHLAPYSFFMGLFGTVLPPYLFSIGMPHVGAGLGSILTSSELPAVMILSTLILHENVTGIQWLGVALILVGIVISNLKVGKVMKKSGF